MTEHKGGIRPPDYMHELAIARVEDLMVQAVPPRLILAKLSDEGVTESIETVKSWIQQVQRRWAAEDAQMRPARKDLWRVRLEAQYNALMAKARDCKSDFAYSQLMAEATRIAKVAIVLDGLTQPVTASTDGKPDPAAMSPMEREREIASLLAKRAADVAAHKTGGAN